MPPRKDKQTEKNEKKTNEKAPKTPKTPGKSADETMDASTMDADETSVQTPVLKQKNKPSKSTDDPTQQTLDKHLKTCAAPDELHAMLRVVSDKLNTLASKAFIESKFKELITEEFLNKKLQEVKQEISIEVKKEIDSLRKELQGVTETVKSQDAVILQLRNKVSDLETNLETLQNNHATFAEEWTEMERKISERDSWIKSLERRNNDLEQYTRRNSIRIYGIDDEKKETYLETWKKVQKVINTNLGLTMKTCDIDIAHRIGKFQRDGCRPVICKFVQRFHKQEVIKARRKLKGSSVVIKEDLTTANAKMLQAASAHAKVKAAWSDEGRIVVLLTNDNKTVISQLGELDTMSVEPASGTIITPL